MCCADDLMTSNFLPAIVSQREKLLDCENSSKNPLATKCGKMNECLGVNINFLLKRGRGTSQ